jgi:hypothetical protein
MESRDDAVAHLVARGFHAQRWDSYVPGAFAVASEAVDIGDSIRLLRHIVVVVPAQGAWSICSEFPVDVQGVSLADAVNAAAALVSELREFGRPKRYAAEQTAPAVRRRD